MTESKERVALVGRRELLAWMGCSPLVGGLGFADCASTRQRAAASSDGPENIEGLQIVFQVEAQARNRLDDDAYAYLSGGASP